MEKKLVFSDVYKEYYYPVFNRIKVRINNDELAKELTNDVFLKVNEFLNIFNPEKSKLITWIFTIVNNKLIDHYRTVNNRKQIDITELNDISENFCITNGAYSNCPTNQRYDKQELNNSIMSAIGKLKGNYKTIAELFFLEEKSYEEISTVLDISMSNVKVTILRTREKLQELLSNVREMAY